jgi:glycosyltransferase involved in cell wall biosynthesis
MRALFIDNLAATFLSHRLPLAQALADRGWEVHAAIPSGDRFADVGRHFTVHRLDLDRRGINPLREADLILRMIGLMRRVRPDVVHLRTPKIWLYGGIAARVVRVPGVISHVTGLGHGRSGSGVTGMIAALALTIIGRVCFRHPNQRVIVQNRDDHGEVAGLGCRRTHLRLVRGSGVDLHAYHPSPGQASSGVPMVVLPARMLREKGVVEFVQAARDLRSRGVPVRMVLIGPTDPDNPSGIPLSQLQEWNSSGVVEWLGPRSDMPAIYAQAAIVCLPSYREGLPKTLLEAMAASLPVVTCDVPGCREPVVAGVTGLLVPSRDPRALAEALAFLLSDPGLRQRMGAAGRRYVVAEFALEIVVAKTLAVFDDIAVDTMVRRRHQRGRATRSGDSRHAR